MRTQGALFQGLKLLRSLSKPLLSLPRKIELHGITGPVEIYTDPYGVHHIHAESEDDLFFAQGYFTAHDRLFQMDYNRHGARGRICELVGRRALDWRALTVQLRGKTTLDVDIFLRAFGIEKAAQDSMPLLSTRATRILDRFTAGVNAYLAQKPMTIEHRILGVGPKPWTSLDSLVLVKAIGFELNYAWRGALLGGMLTQAGLDPTLKNILLPHFPTTGTPVVNSTTYKRMIEEAWVKLQATEAVLPGAGSPGAGSNSFAVAKTHSAQNEALIANDVHLSLSAPGPWYEVRLKGGDIDVHGFALAGVPGIGIGRNQHLAWSITAGLVQDLDLFIEQLDPTNPTQVRTKNGMVPLTQRKEVFRIRHENPHEEIIYSSPHGPLITTVGDVPAKMGQAQNNTENIALSVQWTGQEPASEIDTLVEMWQAKDPEEVQHALRHHGCPTYNITCATKSGRIAYFLAGKLPKRNHKAPLRPLEGWTGDWDWEGTVPFSENPCVVDPPEGFIVTANTRVAAHDFPYALGHVFEPPYRHDRIQEQLQALGDGIGIEDLCRLQLDDHAAWALLVRDAIVPLLKKSTTPNAQAIESLQAFDGHAGTSSKGAGIAYLTGFHLGALVVERLAGEFAARGFMEMGSFTAVPVHTLLDTAGRKALKAAGLDVMELVEQALERALSQHAKGSAGTWGEIHQLRPRHRFDGSALGNFFAIGPVPAPGGPDTINRGDMNPAQSCRVTVGPSLRYVTTGNFEEPAHTILPGGQSGSILSRHYDDQFRLFVEGKYKQVSTQKPEAIKPTHTLEPKSP